MRSSFTLATLLAIANLPSDVLGAAFPYGPYGGNGGYPWQGQPQPQQPSQQVIPPALPPGSTTKCFGNGYCITVPATVNQPAPTLSSTCVGANCLLTATNPAPLSPAPPSPTAVQPTCVGAGCLLTPSSPAPLAPTVLSPAPPSPSAIQPTCVGAGCVPSPVSSVPLVPPTSPSVPNPTNGCGAGGGGIQVQWTGDVVSYSSPVGSGQTQGCLDLTGFQGQVAIGGAGGTILETNPSNYFDVSYILGYTVPVVCSGNGAMTGCNKDLFGNGGKAGQIWKNPTGPGGARDPGSYNGCATCVPWCYACAPPDPFVAPCSGSAYAYPYDDGATVGPATAITCCVGTACPTTGREGSGAAGHPQLSRSPPCGLCAAGAKRSLDQLEEVMDEWKRENRPLSPSLLPRKHKRHGHRFGDNPYSPILADVS